MSSNPGIMNNPDDAATTATTTTTKTTTQSTPLASKDNWNGSNHHGKSRQRDRERERRIALDEAALIVECSSCVGGSINSNDSSQQQQQSYYSLDTFNLLGVVTDPRFVQSPTNSSNSNSSSSMTNAATATATATATSTSSSSYFDTSYYMQSLESTLSSVTGQMESLNHVLEDWSRQFTSSSDGTALTTSTTTDFMSLYTSSSGNIGIGNDLSTKIESLFIKELPSHIQHPNVGSIRQYIEKNGTMASNFHEAILQQKQQHYRLVRTSLTTTGSSNQELVTENMTGDDTVFSANSISNDNRNTTDEDIVDVSFIPLSFFDIDYDLTDPVTFQQLLLLSSSKSVQQRDASNATTTNSNHDLWTIPENDDENIIHKLLPLVPPDHFNVYLDTIELALLQQVRNNSNQFFIESQRFGQLQEMIVSLIEQVIQLQNSNQYIEKNLLQPMIIIPSCDSIRYNLRLLDVTLERIEDMIYCKHGLSGVLSAHDDLTAIEQIHYARQLLNGIYTRRISDSNGNNNDNDKTDNSTNDGNVTIELRRLHAFKAVPDQLKQYEQLVLSNLRDELVEIFLSWSGSSSTGTNIATSIQHDSITLNDTSIAFRTSEQERIQIRVKEVLNALQLCAALNKTRDTYTTRLQDVIRMTVRTTVGEFATDVVVPKGAVQSVSMGASAMTVTRFLDCLDLISEQLILLLSSASSLNEYFIAEGMILQDTINEISNGTTDKNVMESTTASPLASVLATASELMAKSVSELLRLRKDAHSLATLNEMKAIWDACTLFANQVDKFGGGSHTSSIRTTLLAQAKLFVDRRHESNMSSLAAALDSERWIQCEVSSGRQDAITRLCSGLSILSTPLKRTTTNGDTDAQVLKHPELEIEGTRYKVVWSCLLVIEMILTNIATAAHFQSIAINNVSKVSELLRLFNSRTTQLVLGAGAIHSHAKLKSINAKHLSLVTQCLGVIMAIIPHIRAGLMTQLPKKQHMLLIDLEQIRKEYNEHNEKVLNKFVSIIGGIVEHSLAKTIPGTDFDTRAINAMSTAGSSGTTANGEGSNVEISCCAFLEGVSTNIRKMHQVLYTLLPPEHLIDTFSRIFAFVDNKVPALFIAAANIQPIFQQQQSVVGNANNNINNSPDKGVRKGGQQQQQPTFEFPKTNEGKRQFLLEIEAMTKNLNGLEGVRPWDFVAITVIERQLEYSIYAQQSNRDGSNIDNDTDSNPASETVSIMSSNDDVPCTTSGIGDGNENTVPPTISSSSATTNPTQISNMEKQGVQKDGTEVIDHVHDPNITSSSSSVPTTFDEAQLLPQSSSSVSPPLDEDGTNNDDAGVNETENITTTATSNLATTFADTNVAPLAGE